MLQLFSPGPATTEQVAAMRAQAMVAVVGNLLVALVFTFLLWTHVPGYWLSGWLLVLAFINLLRSVVWYRFDDYQHRGRNWLRDYHATVIGNGIVWGVGSLFVLIPGAAFPFVGLIIVAGLCGAALATLSGVFASFAWMVLPAMLPLTLWLLMQDSELHRTSGALAVIYIVIILRAGHQATATLLASIRLAGENRDLAERLSIANRAQGEFLAKMSHELRTPMNGVLGMADLLSRTELGSRQRAFLNTITGSGRALLGVMNDILDYSRMQAGQLDLYPGEIDLEMFCLECISIFSASASDKRIDLLIDIRPGTPMVIIGDAQRLRQVIVNLVGNAVKFTPSGHIILRIMQLEDRGDILTLQFEVEDSGVGISAEQATRLFQPFTQAAGSHDITKGAGLGLSICQELVARMGGHLTAAPNKDAGAVFTFTVRLRKAAVTADTDVAAEGRFGDYLRVLMHITDRTQRQVTRHNLAWQKLQVESTDNIADLLQRVTLAGDAGTGYDVILLSFQEHTSVATAQQLRKLVDADTRIVIISHSADALDMPALHAAGVDERVEQPVTPSVLRDAMRGAQQNRLAASGFANTGKRVLVADDDAVSQQVVSQVLFDMGLQVTSVGNGEDALARLVAEPFDLVILDAQMPGMSGWELIDKLRERERTEQLPHQAILVLSAHTQTAVAEQLDASGADEFISKPFEYANLQATVNRHLRKALH